MGIEITEIPGIGNTPQIRPEIELRIYRCLMIDIIRPPTVHTLPVAVLILSKRVIHTFVVFQIVQINRSKRLGAREITEFHTLLQSSFFHATRYKVASICGLIAQKMEFQYQCRVYPSNRQDTEGETRIVAWFSRKRNHGEYNTGKPSSETGRCSPSHILPVSLSF